MTLKVSDGIGAWIKDFKKSDAPQFKGKDEKERRDMALAAYLDAKRGDKNENVRSADKKPEVYTKPDGKRGVRMVSVDRAIIRKEVSELAMKTDPKIPNLKTPRDKKYNRPKPTSTYKQAKNSSVIRKEQKVNEETNFQVNIEGLPMMFMSGMGQGEIMQKLRKIVKQPSMIQSVKRVTDADVKKTFRLKAQGRDEEEQMDEAKLDELSPATMNSYKRKASDDLYHSSNRYSSTLSKPKTKRDREALDKHIDKRKAGLDLVRKRSGTAGYQDENK